MTSRPAEAVDHAFIGTMTINYKHDIADDVLVKLPATQLFSPLDPVFVYRAARRAPPVLTDPRRTARPTFQETR